MLESVIALPKRSLQENFTHLLIDATHKGFVFFAGVPVFLLEFRYGLSRVVWNFFFSKGRYFNQIAYPIFSDRRLRDKWSKNLQVSLRSCTMEHIANLASCNPYSGVVTFFPSQLSAFEETMLVPRESMAIKALRISCENMMRV
jgi:hypothetical protein